MKRITIIGGGWLGQPLGQHLSAQGHQVYVSKTTLAGVKQLNKEGVNSFQCGLNRGANELNHHLHLHPSDIVIGCFPPGFRRPINPSTDKLLDSEQTETKQSNALHHYIHHWQALIETAKQNNVQRVVMVSSTSVYPNLAKDMHENDANLQLAQANPNFNEKALIMLSAEQALIDSGLEFAIVRCSGLVGPDRHPARFASRLKQVSSLAPANMIHQQDAIGAITFMAFDARSEVVNATTPHTVSKAEFYQAALDKVHSSEPLPPITQQADKRIVADKLIQLGYSFEYQNTLEIL